MKMVGPVWTGPLHDRTFVGEVLNHVKSKSVEKYDKYY
jgi:tRNA G26 N,N-dimethylase Trm1